MNVSHVDMFAGENRTLTFHGRDASNVPVVLTGKTIAFYVGRAPLYPNDPTALITKSGTITGASSGTFTVTLVPDDTTNMTGDYEHMSIATTTVDGSVAVILRGRFRVNPVLRAGT